MSQKIEVFIKPGCPWCVDAVAWLNREGYTFVQHDVITDSARFEEMIALTGQHSAPSMRVTGANGDELVLADFGVEELVPFLQQHGIGPS